MEGEGSWLPDWVSQKKDQLGRKYREESEEEASQRGFISEGRSANSLLSNEVGHDAAL